MSGMNFVRLSIVILLLHSVEVLSQEYGTITGIVYSRESGAPLPGYRVILEQKQSILGVDSSGRDSIQIEETEFKTVTDSLGVYTLILPPGIYSLTLIGDV